MIGRLIVVAIARIHGRPVLPEDQLGTPLSSGCVRQADALFLGTWTPVGTTVVVLH